MGGHIPLLTYHHNEKGRVWIRLIPNLELLPIRLSARWLPPIARHFVASINGLHIFFMFNSDARLIHPRVVRGHGLSEVHSFLEQEENPKEQ